MSIKDFFNPSQEQIFKNQLDAFRRNNIPPRYNQVKLLDELTNKNIDHYISISNRTDGKSFNYIHTLLFICIEYDLGITFLSRNMMLRTSYQELLTEIIDVSEVFDIKDFSFIRTQYYIKVLYQSKQIALISDLNNATELKYFSNFMKKYPIIIYDEFLALESDYLHDEFKRLETIYDSIDRVKEYNLIGKPKIFYFGNAVNFDSPILHGLKLFNILENHPMNTMRVYDNHQFKVALEINRNDNANEQRNTRAFDSGNDSMATAQFKTNSFMLASENDLAEVRKNPRIFYIKLEDTYIKVHFNRDTLKIILGVESVIEDDYTFNLMLKDNKKSSIYLDERYIDERHEKKIEKGLYLFENNYTKQLITNQRYSDLNILKMVKKFIALNDTHEIEVMHKEKQYEQNYIEISKKAIARKFFD